MKRRGSKQEEEPKLKRNEIQRNIATTRAPHFARLEKKKLSNSSTPTGVHDHLQNTLQQESWPGPFSVAHEMISKREDAKLLREKMISEKDQQETIGDDYDQYLSNINVAQLEELYKSNQIGKGKTMKIPSLTTLCSELLAQHIDNVESTGDLSVESKTELAMHLSKLRKLTCQNLLLIINGTREANVEQIARANLPGMSCLILEDCSSIDEETMIKAICNANGFFAKTLTSSVPAPQLTGEDQDQFQPSLKSLILKNCGHSFTSWMVSRLNHYQILKNLEYLTLAGLYRLSDEYLSEFFLQLNHSAITPHNSLRSIDLSYCSSLSSLGLTAILNSSPLLTTLVLDYTPLDQTSLLLLCSRQYDIPHLTELSLSGITSLTDSILAFLLSADSQHLISDPCFEIDVDGDRDGDGSGNGSKQIPSCPPPTSSSMKPLGQRLKLLCLKECHLLTDNCFISIRNYCSEIMNLNLSSVKSFKSPVNLLGLFVTQFLPSFDHSHSHSSSLPPTIPQSIGSHLQHLSLSGLTNCVTDEVIIEACRLSNSFNSSHHGLISLDISGCSQLTNRTLIGIKHHCHHSLRSLDLSFVRSFTAEVLFALVYSCHQLENLSLWGCTQLKNSEKKKISNEVIIEKIANKNIMDLIEAKVGLEVVGC